VTSRWVRGEAREGADRGILVPVRFEGASLPIDARALHTTDLDNWGEDPAAAGAGSTARVAQLSNATARQTCRRQLRPGTVR